MIILFFCLSAFGALDVKFVAQISQTPDPAAVGNEVTLTVSFKPEGGAVTNFKIIGGVGEGPRLLERVYASIPANTVRTDSFKLTIPNNDYTYTAWFRLDPDKTSGDSNYDNNLIVKVISISGPKKAVHILEKPGTKAIDLFFDLLVTRIYLQSEQNTPDVHARHNIAMLCEWKRRGPEPEEDFAIELYVDGVKMPCHSITCIGHKYTTWARATAKIWIDLSGNHEFKCVLNNPTADEEVSKANNTMVKTIFIPD